MKIETRHLLLSGALGQLEAIVDTPSRAQSPIGIALIAHPHPLFGGTFENKVVQTLARTLAEAGYIAIRTNFRGVGKSEGTHDEGRGEVEDLIHVVDWARKEYGGELALILAGFSFGGFVQLRVSRRVHPKKLILIAPAVGRLSVGDFEDTGEVPHDTVIVHGDEDDVVPLQAVIDWAKPKQLPIILLPGAGHFFHGRLTQLKEMIHWSLVGNV